MSLPYQQIADLAHQSETEFNGLKCGIMDEYAIALGKKNQSIILDCGNRTFTYAPVSFKPYALVVIVSNVKRELLKSPYNKRVEECNAALEIIKTKFNISNLCELKISDLEVTNALVNDKVLVRRVKHVVSENERVKVFVYAMKDNNLLVAS